MSEKRTNLQKTWRIAVRSAIGIATAVCVVGVGAILAVSLANRAGYSVAGMKSGSMQPEIKAGDLVVAQAVDPAVIRPGDVITFREPFGSHALYTHRVYQVVATASGPAFITKGDANPAPDSWRIVYAGGPAWRVTHVLHGASFALLAIQEGPGHDALAISVFIVMLALVWPVLFDRRKSAPAALEVAA